MTINGLDTMVMAKLGPQEAIDLLIFITAMGVTAITIPRQPSDSIQTIAIELIDHIQAINTAIETTIDLNTIDQAQPTTEALEFMNTIATNTPTMI